MKNCWEIKHCPFAGKDIADSKCPAYAQHTPCWEFDWLSFHRGMPDGPEKREWKRMMREWCSACVVRDAHSLEVDAFIKTLRRT